MAGYWNNPEATAEAFAGGWFHSGDLVRQDDEGYVWVVDRKKDMIISGGENIYCAEVENVLAGHPAIVEVAVIGRPHDEVGRGAGRRRGTARCADGRRSSSTISTNSSPNGWRGTSIRRRSRSSTHCRATPPARSSRRN